jgi:hypothetical protein
VLPDGPLPLKNHDIGKPEKTTAAAKRFGDMRLTSASSRRTVATLTPLAAASSCGLVPTNRRACAIHSYIGHRRTVHRRRPLAALPKGAISNKQRTRAVSGRRESRGTRLRIVPLERPGVHSWC